MDLKRFLREHLPGLSPELRRLVDSAADNTTLLHADFLAIADMLDISGYRTREPVFVLLLTLFLALEEGSLGVAANRDRLASRLADLLPAAEARSWAERILADFASDGWPALVGRAPDAHRPVILYQPDLAAAAFFYFHKYLRGELAFKQRLEERLTHAPLATEMDWRPVLDDVLHTHPWLVRNKPLQLDRDQLLALGLALSQNLVVISGGPGTGKTSLVLTMLRCFLRAGLAPEALALAAPTGRAAQRLADSLRPGLSATDVTDRKLALVQPTTLHQLLQYSPKQGIFRRHVENPIPADVVVVDEVSMVDVVLMARLLEALKPDTRLILLGDKDQLPSVEAGAVLSSLVPPAANNRYSSLTADRLAELFDDMNMVEKQGDTSPTPTWARRLLDHVVLLRTNHRSERHIRETAQAINRQDTELVERLPRLATVDEGPTLPEEEGCWFYEQTANTPVETRRLVQLWAERAYLAKYPGLVRHCANWQEADEHCQELLPRLFEELESSRILTVLREGPWGSTSLNAFLDDCLRGRLDRQSRAPLFAGAPVLITANDHTRRLYNGDVGIALPAASSLRVFFRRADSFVSFAAESLPAHELGFALTVHKSQGSEYERVLLILPPTGGRRLLTKEILYTGITRAKSQAVLCASADLLRFALARKTVRESGLFGAL